MTFGRTTATAEASLPTSSPQRSITHRVLPIFGADSVTFYEITRKNNHRPGPFGGLIQQEAQYPPGDLPFLDTDRSIHPPAALHPRRPRPAIHVPDRNRENPRVEQRDTRNQSEPEIALVEEKFVVKTDIPPYGIHVIHAAIFDLDGTLVDSLPGIKNSLNRALAARNHPTHEEDAVESFIGNGSWMLCRRGIPQPLPDSEADEVNKLFMEDYDRTWLEGTTVFPGIIDLITVLKAMTMPLAVLSNKPDAFTKAITASLFGDSTFDAVLGHRSGTEPKPDPKASLEIAGKLGVRCEHIAFVGDSLVDLETAKNSRMRPLLVGWGYRPIEELRSSGAKLVSTPKEVLNALKSGEF